MSPQWQASFLTAQSVSFQTYIGQLSLALMFACRDVEGLGSFGDVRETDSQLVVTEAVRDVMLTLVPWLQNSLPVLLLGPEGCGKACLLQHCFKQLPVSLPSLPKGHIEILTLVEGPKQTLCFKAHVMKYLIR